VESPEPSEVKRSLVRTCNEKPDPIGARPNIYQPYLSINNVTLFHFYRKLLALILNWNFINLQHEKISHNFIEFRLLAVIYFVVDADIDLS
jgi:hypothetical protein